LGAVAEIAVGIDKLRVWPSTLALDMRTLVDARGADAREVVDRMMIDQRSVPPAWEDPVTMAVNAADELLDDEERSRVRLLLVASESGPDQEKALSTWVQRWLGLPDDCRNLEVKHACYGGTAALQLASHWLLGQADDALALVVTTDCSRQHFHRPHEFVMGAGACAMVVSKNPRFLRLDLGRSGVYTHEVSDLTRPTSRVEAGHSETSLLSYLDAVDITLQRYREAVGRRDRVALESPEQLRAWAPFSVYHAPFGGITLRAHRAALRSLGLHDRTAVAEDFSARIAPTLRFNRRMGGTYGSSVFVSLLGLADALPDGDLAGRRVSIYSYGSGSCAETYSGVFGPTAGTIARRANLGELLDARRSIGVREYEEAERERTCWIDDGDHRVSLDGHDDLLALRYRGRLTYRGNADHVRQYERA
jgi:3-hydroxy-3-methylglutaryl CoA synthase